MSNQYAINTTRRKEFDVEQELRDIGLQPWAPRMLASKYIKEKREVIWYDRPYIHKLIFCAIPAISWRNVVELKHVIGKPIQLSRLDIDGVPAHVKKSTGVTAPAVPGLRQFQDAVEAEYEDASRRKRNSEYQCQYAPGQALEMLSGPFEGYRALFKDVIRRQHDDYARLRVEMDLMGGKTVIEVDPDSVRVG